VPRDRVDLTVSPPAPYCVARVNHENGPGPDFYLPGEVQRPHACAPKLKEKLLGLSLKSNHLGAQGTINCNVLCAELGLHKILI